MRIRWLGRRRVSEGIARSRVIERERRSCAEKTDAEKGGAASTERRGAEGQERGIYF